VDGPALQTRLRIGAPAGTAPAAIAGQRYRCKQIGSFAKAQELLRQGPTWCRSPCRLPVSSDEHPGANAPSAPPPPAPRTRPLASLHWLSADNEVGRRPLHEAKEDVLAFRHSLRITGKGLEYQPAGAGQ
jgi:hypothetical protein